MNWSPEVEAWLNDGEFDRVSAWYENKIEQAESEGAIELEDYFYLGLSYLLAGREEEAQTTWFLTLSQTEGELITQLLEILEREAIRQQTIHQLDRSWLIRAHIRELEPEDVNNIFSLYGLEIDLNIFSVDNLTEVRELLLNSNEQSIDTKVLEDFFSKLLSINSYEIIDIVEIILYKFTPNIFIKTVEIEIDKVANKNKELAVNIINVCLKRQPNNLHLAKQLVWYYVDIEKYPEAQESAYKFYDLCESLPEKAFGAYLVVLVMMTCGYWREMEEPIKEYKRAFQNSLDAGQCPSFLGRECLIVSHLAYIGDDLKDNRAFTNRNGQLYQEAVQKKYGEKIVKYRNPKITSDKIKIGYIGHTLKFHSIGVISRWLMNYHDREKFIINTYLVNQVEDFITKEYFRDKADNCYNLPDDAVTVAQQISDDNIDILIDVDSVTGWTTSEVMALKPADIQVSWLGWDGAGIPTIDYYLADNYVLPENAQDYYVEKIWRLPNSYIAIDGMEIGIPTLRRTDLGISLESVIYLTAQTSYKRNPESIRLQLQVLKAVPDSYLLIQGKGGAVVIKSLFERIAEEEGVNPDRLRFLPLYPVTNYRANLGIADVILDTYPFNGGTMTLDSLWMGIPMVTKVGQQWASRNGYTLMVNAGLSEGIAWNDEDYIEWGIRLGKDRELREDIRWKLQQSRQKAPLWDGRQFTRDVESAYRQMWAIYQSNK